MTCPAYQRARLAVALLSRRMDPTDEPSAEHVRAIAEALDAVRQDLLAAAVNASVREMRNESKDGGTEL